MTASEVQVDADTVTLDQSFYDGIAKAVGERLKQCGNRVPVVTGYFGPVPGSLIKQVGRGYTDLLAALAAVGTEAAELQIWKEVDGIFTADPRKVPTARLVPVVSPEEAAELTYYGSEVVHPFTMEQVIRRSIPIRIKNVKNPGGGGTVIHPDADKNHEFGRDQPLRLINGGSIDISSLDALPPVAAQPLLPTAATIKEYVTVLNISSNRKIVAHGFLANIFTTLDKHNIIVDMISTSEVHVSMALDPSLSNRSLDKVTNDLRKYGTVSVHPQMCIISLIGKEMRNTIGFSGRFFATLAQGHVNIEMISQGMNEINISAVINQRDAVKALNLIHQSCLQIRPDSNAHGRG